MPYLKGKGIRDLYLIKVARVGNRKEGQPDEDKNDFRLVFEIEFVKQLFDDYNPVELKIWKTFTDTTLQTIIHYQVVCAVIINQGEVLCMQKGQTKYEYTSYHWEFPGGKIEPGESPEEALHRELLEEMEYDVRVGRHLCTVEHTYPDFAITMAAYLCEADNRDFTMKEHSASLWIKLEHLTDIEWCAADKPIAMELIVKL